MKSGIGCPFKKSNHCVNSVALKYFDNPFPHYLNKVFMKAPKSSS